MCDFVSTLSIKEIFFSKQQVRNSMQVLKFHWTSLAGLGSNGYRKVINRPLARLINNLFLEEFKSLPVEKCVAWSKSKAFQMTI